MIVKSLLSIAHYSADVEQSLSVNKKTVSPERTALGGVTINGMCRVKDHVEAGAT